MENQTERTIYFKDLVFSVLYSWKAIVAAMLIGALLLGGLALLDKEDTVLMDAVSLTPENQIKVDQYQKTLERTQKLIESHAVYLEESVLMSLDSYAAYTAGACVSISPETQAGAAGYEQAIAVAHVYRTGLMDTAVMDAIAKQHSMKTDYLRELITVDVISGGVLNIMVRGRTQEEAKTIAQALTQEVEAQHESLDKSVKLQVSSFSKGPAVDRTLYDLQNAAHQRMTTLKNTVTSAETELNKLLPNQLQAGKPQPVLFAAVGAFLGAFLVAAFACVKHIGSGKVYSARTFQDRTGLRILGRVCGKKRNVVDRWLRKLEGRATHTQPDAIIANIKNRCADVKKLLVFGASDAQLLQPLTEKLTAAGIQTTLCAEPAGSAKAIQTLPECDAAVLVAECGQSAYDEVIWIGQTVNEYGKTLLGCVLIDG